MRRLRLGSGSGLGPGLGGRAGGLDDEINSTQLIQLDEISWSWLVN